MDKAFFHFMLVFLFSLQARAQAPQIPPALDPNSIPGRAYSVLAANCASCHNSILSFGGMGYVLDARQLITSGRVIPGDANRSPLYQAIRENRMPLGTNLGIPLDNESKRAVQRWINDGARGFPEVGVAAAPITTTSAELEVIEADLRRVASNNRQFMRYVLLNHVSNNVLLSANQRTMMSQAVAKALNSVHWRSAISLPTPLVDSATVLRIDLRNYDISRNEWESLVANAYPYNSQYTSNSGFDEIQDLARSQSPVVRADWLAQQILQPQVYSRLIELGDNIEDIEERIGVDAERNIRNGRVMRLGFRDSGVSFSNRMIERHQGRFGPYWKSYDFADDDRGVQNIFQNPLGPEINGGVAGVDERVFQHDGGEMIFALPNGLHGYALTDAAGNYLDVGPTEIVVDPNRRDNTVTNSVSCFACHSSGWIRAPDEIRASISNRRNNFSNNARRAVERLYADEATIKSTFDRDIEAYRVAVEKLGIIAGAGEPVSMAALSYERDLDINQVAAELDLSPDQLRSVIGRNSNLRNILGRLTNSINSRQRPVISRRDFERNFSNITRSLRSVQGPRSSD